MLDTLLAQVKLRLPSRFYLTSTDNLGCCPTGGTCCTAGCCKSSQSCCGINRCADPGDTCCTLGTCPSGWKCCTPGTCYPVGGQCCATGQYCTAGNICVLVRGLQKCCTDVRCTAHVSGGVTLTAAAGANDQTKTSVALTTKATTSVVTEEILIWYYFTIIWFVVPYYRLLDTDDSTAGIITPTSGPSEPASRQHTKHLPTLKSRHRLFSPFKIRILTALPRVSDRFLLHSQSLLRRRQPF